MADKMMALPSSCFERFIVIFTLFYPFGIFYFEILPFSRLSRNNIFHENYIK